MIVTLTSVLKDIAIVVLIGLVSWLGLIALWLWSAMGHQMHKQKPKAEKRTNTL